MGDSPDRSNGEHPPGGGCPVIALIINSASCPATPATSCRRAPGKRRFDSQRKGAIQSAGDLPPLSPTASRKAHRAGCAAWGGKEENAVGGNGGRILRSRSRDGLRPETKRTSRRHEERRDAGETQGQRQPRAGAICVSIVSITCAL